MTVGSGEDAADTIRRSLYGERQIECRKTGGIVRVANKSAD